MKSAAVALVIYAYSSFASNWGAGPAIVKKFEKVCQCKVELVNAGDGGTLFSRLKLEKSHSRADVVLGFDASSLPRVKKQLKWTEEFKSFDFAPYAFVYDSRIVKDPPESLDDLLDAKWKGEIVIEDPRLSTVGMGFLLWVMKEKGAEKGFDYLRQLKTQLKTVTPSWDLAYGMFKKKQAKLVFSYWTSPAYHIQEENVSAFKAAPFKAGHYVQREYLSVVPTTKNREMAEKFVDFVLSEEAQEVIPKLNYMYPANLKAPLTPAFKKLGKAKTMDALTEEELSHIDDWLKTWRDIFSS